MSFDGVDAVRRESTYRSISEGMSVDPSLSEQNDAVSDFLEKEITLLSDPSKGTILRASSILQKNSKLYGPMNALDGSNDSSSWNSEGSTQTETKLILQFGRTVIPTEIKFQFQAGFSAEIITVYDSQMKELGEIQLEDVYELQSCGSVFGNQSAVTSIKLVMDNFSDFYGRVILYRLEVWGFEVPI